MTRSPMAGLRRLFYFLASVHGRIDDSRCPSAAPHARRDAGSDLYAWLEEAGTPRRCS